VNLSHDLERSRRASRVAHCCGVLCLLLAACGHGVSQAKFAGAALAAVSPMEAVAQSVSTARRNDSLAYEHSVEVELGRDLLSPRMKQVQAACATRSEFACVLLDVSFDAQLGVPSGRVSMRLAPTAVDPLIEMAAQDGRITARSTHAEDLAEPVADTDRQLALLSSHRDRLTEFMKSKELKVEQLIAVSKELAAVQVQIDALNTQHANLRRRIDTEILTISFAPPQQAYSEERTPVRDALRSFSGDFKGAIAQVIRFIAVLLPWLVVIIPGLLLGRLLWRALARGLGRWQRPS
jgi:Domain of unknown function (DUF4349)